MEETGAVRPARVLEQVEIFSSLSPDEIDDIAQICAVDQFPAGTWLFHAGDRGACAWIVVSGAIEVVIEGGTRTEQLAVLGPHAVLGELSLIEPDLRTASARALEDTVALRLDYERFTQLRDMMNAASHKLMRELSRIVCLRIRDVNDRIEALSDSGVAASDPQHSGQPAEERRSTLTNLLKRLWGGSKTA